MDDRAALIARRVALAASAWMNAPADYEAYRRMAVAVAEWNDYTSPTLSGQGDTEAAEREDEDEEELVDVDQLPPPIALAEWRNIDGAWDGRVVHAVQEDDGWTLVEE